MTSSALRDANRHPASGGTRAAGVSAAPRPTRGAGLCEELIQSDILFDPATPYRGAVTVDRLLPRSRLLTLAGWGHTPRCSPRPASTPT
jgi:TAP-like protein